MKKRVYTINNKRIVEGDSNLVTFNEILVQHSNNGIKLVERVNEGLVTISKGDDNNGGDPGNGDTSGIKRHGVLLVTPYIDDRSYGYRANYDSSNTSYIDYDKYVIPITWEDDLYSGSVEKATIPSSILTEKIITSIPKTDADLSNIPVDSPTSGVLIGLSLYKDREQCEYISKIWSDLEGLYIDKYIADGGNSIYTSNKDVYRFSKKPYLVSIQEEAISQFSCNIVAYNYPIVDYYMAGGIYVNIPDELAGNVRISVGS